MTNRNDFLEEALLSIRQEHKSIEAPADIKERLVEMAELNARTSQPVRRSLRLAASLVAALAAVCAVGAFYLYWAGRSVPRQHTDVAVVTAPRTVPAVSVDASPLGLRPATSSDRRAGAKSLPVASANNSGFFVLPSSEGLPAPSMTALVRVRIRRDDLRQYGLDVSPTNGSEMVVAEFVVGQDGLSRAVRFIR